MTAKTIPVVTISSTPTEQEVHLIQRGLYDYLQTRMETSPYSGLATRMSIPLPGRDGGRT
jgi:hypothetical protein